MAGGNHENLNPLRSTDLGHGSAAGGMHPVQAFANDGVQTGPVKEAGALVPAVQIEQAHNAILERLIVGAGEQPAGMDQNSRDVLHANGITDLGIEKAHGLLLDHQWSVMRGDTGHQVKPEKLLGALLESPGSVPDGTYMGKGNKALQEHAKTQFEGLNEKI